MPIQPHRQDWPRLLRELTRQLDDGRIYDRDLPRVADALEDVLAAYHRRTDVLARPNP